MHPMFSGAAQHIGSSLVILNCEYMAVMLTVEQALVGLCLLRRRGPLHDWLRPHCWITCMFPPQHATIGWQHSRLCPGVDFPVGADLLSDHWGGYGDYTVYGVVYR